jgi:hypothetical protein
MSDWPAEAQDMYEDSWRYCIVTEEGRVRSWGRDARQIQRGPLDDEGRSFVKITQHNGQVDTFALNKRVKFYSARNALFNPSRKIDVWLKACEEEYARGLYKWKRME